MLWSKEERNGVCLEVEPSFNPRKITLHDGDAVAMWVFDPIAMRPSGLKYSIPTNTIVAVTERVNAVGNVILRISKKRMEARPADGKVMERLATTPKPTNL